MLACVVSYCFFDLPLAKYFENISGTLSNADKFITDLIDPNNHYFLWPILYFVFRFMGKKEFLANRCLLILMSIPLSNLVIEILKSLLGRARPKLLYSQDLFGFTFLSFTNAFKSFPSGHACTIGAICGAVACFYPRATFFLTSLALLLAFTRIILAQHYLSDIIAGVAAGILLSQWIYGIMRKQNIPFY